MVGESENPAMSVTSTPSGSSTSGSLRGANTVKQTIVEMVQELTLHGVRTELCAAFKKKPERYLQKTAERNRDSVTTSSWNSMGFCALAI